MAIPADCGTAALIRVQFRFPRPCQTSNKDRRGGQGDEGSWRTVNHFKDAGAVVTWIMCNGPLLTAWRFRMNTFWRAMQARHQARLTTTRARKDRGYMR